jgi:flagellar biosynthesis/type III secretory pathway chaperone
MQFSDTDNNLQLLLSDLEKQFHKFEKGAIFKVLSKVYKKEHPFMHLLTQHEMERIKEQAIAELNKNSSAFLSIV